MNEHISNSKPWYKFWGGKKQEEIEKDHIKDILIKENKYLEIL